MRNIKEDLNPIKNIFYSMMYVGQLGIISSPTASPAKKNKIKRGYR